ncbi:hypothetical protein [Nocardia sp.]|uniref:hypothetical protein n=1 Tax=Nocardia sp. TaxID=1821 RepID=UPI002605864C|nr:hypothetical protein [Nocardia sp.]
MMVVIGCLAAAGCSKDDSPRAWYSPKAGSGTEDRHVVILDGTTDGSTTATVHATYRCPSSERPGGKMNASLSYGGKANGPRGDKDDIAVTCDGVEHPFGITFPGAFPANDDHIYADVLMWLPTGPSTTIPGPIPGTAGMVSTDLQDVASDAGHNLALKTG